MKYCEKCGYIVYHIYNLPQHGPRELKGTWCYGCANKKKEVKNGAEVQHP